MNRHNSRELLILGFLLLLSPITMPRYEYKCNNKKCETDTFEEIQSFTDKPKAKCPDCNKITKDKKSVYGFNFTI
jgi:putative FmdB family regulatory protein